MAKRTKEDKRVIKGIIDSMSYFEIVDVPDEYKTGKAKRYYAHDCYRQAFRYLLYIRPKGILLVHGSCVMGDTRFAHAWIELPGDIIFDGVLQRFYNKNAYYSFRKAIKEAEYSYEEAILTASDERGFGPWVPSAGAFLED